MNTGYVKLYRSSLDDPIFLTEPFTKWQAWCDLLLSAYPEPADLFFRGIKVTANVGCVYVGARELAERWRWSRGKVNRFLACLVSEEKITIESSNVVNCIKIVGYDNYRGDAGHDEQEYVSMMMRLEELEAMLKKQEEKPKKTKKASNPLITLGRDVFEKKYLDVYGDSYYWQAKDAVAMDALTKKIIYSRQQKGMSTGEGDVIKALSALLDSIQDEWILKNFSVTNINSKYNEIVAYAKAKKKNSNGTDARTRAAGAASVISRLEEREGEDDSQIR